MLETVIDIVGNVNVNMRVGERLVELAPQFPLECVRTLAAMIARAKDSWLILAIREHAKRVIRIARDSANGDANFIARKLAEDLISRQHVEFREVL